MTPKHFVFTVTQAYQNCKGIFVNKINAEDLVPLHASKLQTALFLFYVIQLDYAMKSQILYKGAQKLFDENPDFFTPKNILSVSIQELTNIITKNLHPRYINEALSRYKINSDLLLKKYGGDPRNIFNTKESVDAEKRVREFRGFGPKIGNFFIRTMINHFNYSYPDIDKILPPVDVHDVRIAYLFGYVKTANMTIANINNVKKIWSVACKEANVSWLTFDKALWLLGSEGKPKTKEDVLGLIK